MQQPKSRGSALRGFLQGVNARNIVGWAWNRENAEKATEVEIYVDDVLLATVEANQFHQGLVDAKIGNGKHRFVYSTPESLKDGKPHTIRAKVAGTNVELKKSPRVFTYAPQTGAGKASPEPSKEAKEGRN